MTLFRKLSARRSSASAGNDDPAARLRAEISALEADVAASTQTLADLHNEMGAVEAQAMEAIRAGNDRAARDCLVAQQAYAEKAAGIAADLEVLRTILDEYATLMKKAGESAGPGS